MNAGYLHLTYNQWKETQPHARNNNGVCAAPARNIKNKNNNNMNNNNKNNNNTNNNNKNNNNSNNNNKNNNNRWYSV